MWRLEDEHGDTEHTELYLFFVCSVPPCSPHSTETMMYPSRIAPTERHPVTHDAVMGNYDVPVKNSSNGATPCNP